MDINKTGKGLDIHIKANLTERKSQFGGFLSAFF